MTGFWHGRRVVVTGGAGMLGASVCRQLVSLGAEAVALDLTPPTVPGARFVQADICDAAAVGAALAGADVVIHCCACPAPSRHPRPGSPPRRLGD